MLSYDNISRKRTDSSRRKKTRSLARFTSFHFLQRNIRPQNSQPSTGSKASTHRLTGRISWPWTGHQEIPLNSFIAVFPLLPHHAPKESRSELSDSLSDSLEHTQDLSNAERNKPKLIKGPETPSAKMHKI